MKLLKRIFKTEEQETPKKKIPLVGVANGYDKIRARESMEADPITYCKGCVWRGEHLNPPSDEKMDKYIELLKMYNFNQDDMYNGEIEYLEPKYIPLIHRLAIDFGCDMAIIHKAVEDYYNTNKTLDV